MNLIFKYLKKIIFSSLLIYSYDLFCFAGLKAIAINFFTVLFVSFFGSYAMVGLIFLSFSLR